MSSLYIVANIAAINVRIFVTNDEVSRKIDQN